MNRAWSKNEVEAAIAKRSFARPRDVGPARPERSTLKLNRAPPPKEGNRQNALARFDRISPARENAAEPQ